LQKLCQKITLVIFKTYKEREDNLCKQLEHYEQYLDNQEKHLTSTEKNIIER